MCTNLTQHVISIIFLLDIKNDHWQWANFRFGYIQQGAESNQCRAFVENGNLFNDTIWAVDDWKRSNT